MNALIVSNRPAPWIRSYFPGFSEFSLLLADKPLVEHQLDWCARKGVETVRILDAAYDAQLIKRLGDGSRWGLKLTYARIPATDDCAHVVAANADFLETGESLVIHGLELEYGGKIHRIDSIRDYFELNFRLIDSPCECVLPGYYSEHGVNLGMNVQIRMGCKVNPPVLLDDNCRVDHNCRLNGEVIVGEGSILDRGARLHWAIVYPQTYIARDVELENKIVVGTRVIDPMTGGCVNLAGDVLSADLSSHGRGFIHRVGRFLRHLRGMVVHHAG